MPDELADAGGVDPANGRSCPRERPDERLLPDGGEPDSNDVADSGTDSNPGDSESEPESAAATDSDSDSSSSEAASEREVDDETEMPPVETDGEGVVNPDPGAGTGTGKGRGSGKGSGETHYPDNDDDIGGLETPPDDEEMPLADHIEEMVLRLAVVLLFGAAGTAIGLLGASDAIAFIWGDVFPTASDAAPPPHIYHPLELWLTRIKLSALLGIMVALPTFVYECYLFMKPGLYPHERKYYLAAVPTSVVLGAIGMLFSYHLVLPVLFQYFTYYAEGSAEIAYALGETFSLIITLTGFLAIVFQIPLFIMLAIMMGVTTRRWLAQKRLYFWAAFAGLAFMFTFDPSGMAPILVAITMILLFEGTLAILKWVGTE